MAEWLVRFPERTVLLPANITELEIIDAEGFDYLVPTITDSVARAMVEDDMACADDTNFWVCIRYNAICVKTGAMLPQFTVLCGTTTRVAADRIISALVPVMFSRCEFDNIVDFRSMMRADSDAGAAAVSLKADAESQAVSAGRFVDLDDTGVSTSAGSRRDVTVNVTRLMKRIETAVIEVESVSHAGDPNELAVFVNADRARSVINASERVETMWTPERTASVPVQPQAAMAIPSLQDVARRAEWRTAQSVQSVGRGVDRQDAIITASELAATINRDRAVRDRSGRPPDL